MDGSEKGVKAKTLAVFQNVVTKEKQNKRKKFRPHRFSDDDSSPSESELVIDDEVKEEAPKRKRHGVRIRFKEEILRMQCEWDHCSKVFQNPESMNKHLVEHVSDMTDDLDCKWKNCPNPTNIFSHQVLIGHISYHGYLARLINVGENILERNNLPACHMTPKYTINVYSYTCQWEGCNYITFDTIFDFFVHIECHVNAAPSGKEVESKEVISCEWNCCVAKFPTRYKLADHLRVHTKERMIACPNCVCLFSTKTTFSDHRKRQLKTDLRSYQCSQCLKLFPTERILSDHMRSHINQYKCTVCDMTSTKPSMLASHYRYRHMDARPFPCHRCDKAFISKSNLDHHLLTHTKNPFKCEQCDFGCKSKVGLSTHVLKVHGIEKPFYECQVCKALFRRGNYLTKHLIRNHKFHWPSGHTRFRYRKDSDGVCRLQTVRYESLEVTEQMIKSESMKAMRNPSAVTYNITYDKNEANGYKLTVSQDNQLLHTEDTETDKAEKEEKLINQEIIISIEDLDEKGNVLQKQEIGSGDIFLLSPEGVSQQSDDDVMKDDDEGNDNKDINFETVFEDLDEKCDDVLQNQEIGSGDIFLHSPDGVSQQSNDDVVKDDDEGNDNKDINFETVFEDLDEKCDDVLQNQEIGSGDIFLHSPDGVSQQSNDDVVKDDDEGNDNKDINFETVFEDLDEKGNDVLQNQEIGSGDIFLHSPDGVSQQSDDDVVKDDDEGNDNKDINFETVFEDLDEKGNVLQNQEIGSGDICLLSPDGVSQQSDDDDVVKNDDECNDNKVTNFESVWLKED